MRPWPKHSGGEIHSERRAREQAAEKRAAGRMRVLTQWGPASASPLDNKEHTTHFVSAACAIFPGIDGWEKCVPGWFIARLFMRVAQAALNNFYVSSLSKAQMMKAKILSICVKWRAALHICIYLSFRLSIKSIL